MGSLVVHSPNCPMAENAFAELQHAFKLYDYGTRRLKTRRHQSGWRSLQKIYAKAHRVYSQHRSGTASVPTELTIRNSKDSKDTQDELAILGGQTRVLLAKQLSGQRIENSCTASSTGTPPQQGGTDTAVIPDAHPALAAYFCALPNTNGEDAQFFLVDPPLKQFSPADFMASNIGNFGSGSGSSSDPSTTPSTGSDVQWDQPSQPHGEFQPMDFSDPQFWQNTDPAEELFAPVAKDLDDMMNPFSKGSQAGIDDQWHDFLRQTSFT